MRYCHVAQVYRWQLRQFGIGTKASTDTALCFMRSAATARSVFPGTFIRRSLAIGRVRAVGDILCRYISAARPLQKGVTKLAANAINVLLCGGFCVLAAAAPPVKAADVSGQVLGTTYSAIMVNYWSVINNNVAGGGHYVRRVTPYNCAATPSGWVAGCQVAGALFDEFISNPTCAGRADCAFSSTLIFGAKHKVSIFNIVDVATWAWEALHWCLNTPECANPCPECVAPQWCDGEGVMLSSCDGGPVDPFLNDLSNNLNAGFDELMINYYTNTTQGIMWGPDGLGPWGIDSEESKYPGGGQCPDPGIVICL